MFNGFGRNLNKEELEILFRILPERKPGYSLYRSLIKAYYLIGPGSSDDSFLLHKDKDAFIHPFITPVFASGSFKMNNRFYDITIHEETDSSIEIEISETNQSKDAKETIYSEWEPGLNAPGDNSRVREIILQHNRYVLAIAPVQKKVWLFDYSTGVNHLLSAGAYYNSLCLVRNERKSEIVLNPKMLFNNLDNYIDIELVSAFYSYNKSIRKFNIEIPAAQKQNKKEGFLKRIFRKG